MGALSGSLTFSRFFVMGDVPEDVPGTTLKRIRAQAFQPLIAEEEPLQKYGWASVEDPFDTDLDHEKVFFNEYVALGLRVDRWAIPGPLLKASLKEAEAKALAKRGTERLGRQAKAELKDMVVKKLRKQLVPVTKNIDLIWSLQSKVALFFSHSKKIHELVQELFEKTFRLQLLVESPGTAANRRGLDQGAKSMFESLVPTTLANESEVAARLIQKELAS